MDMDDIGMAAPARQSDNMTALLAAVCDQTASGARMAADLHGHQPIAGLFSAFLSDRPDEAAILAGFDGVGRLVYWAESKGSSAKSVQIGSAALRSMMAQPGLITAILAHNHPAGTPAPSEADMAFTRDLASMCRYCGIHLYDHLIFAGARWYSFRDDGLI